MTARIVVIPHFCSKVSVITSLALLSIGLDSFSLSSSSFTPPVSLESECGVTSMAKGNTNFVSSLLTSSNGEHLGTVCCIFMSEATATRLIALSLNNLESVSWWRRDEDMSPTKRSVQTYLATYWVRHLCSNSLQYAISMKLIHSTSPEAVS